MRLFSLPLSYLPVTLLSQSIMLGLPSHNPQADIFGTGTIHRDTRTEKNMSSNLLVIIFVLLACTADCSVKERTANMGSVALEMTLFTSRVR